MVDEGIAESWVPIPGHKGYEASDAGYGAACCGDYLRLPVFSLGTG